VPPRTRSIVFIEAIGAIETIETIDAIETIETIDAIEAIAEPIAFSFLQRYKKDGGNAKKTEQKTKFSRRLC
jgi:hypothetical protein